MGYTSTRTYMNKDTVICKPLPDFKEPVPVPSPLSPFEISFRKQRQRCKLCVLIRMDNILVEIRCFKDAMFSVFGWWKLNDR